MKKIDYIRVGCLSLPVKDKELALKLVDERDFEELAMLINSVIALYEVNLLKEEPSDELLNLDIDDILRLSLLVNDYISQL